MKNHLILRNGTVYDPLNQIDGEILDICISKGKIVEKVPESTRSIDLKGKVVMPGGVDLHSHILGSKMNTARATSPESNRHHGFPVTKKTRSGVNGILPSSYALGYQYSIMGYTTVIEPALPAVKALSAWEEIEDIPGLDIGMLPLFCNSMITFKYVRDKDIPGLAAYIAWTLQKVGGFGVKVVNPGGTYVWANGRNIRLFDTEVPEWGITPRQITTSLVKAVELLGLPHSLHYHPNNLGRVGNIKTTIEQLDALRKIKGHNGRKQVLHLAHMSFDCIGMVDGGKFEWKDIACAGSEFAEYFERNNHFSLDLGQITYGPAMTMTADGPFQFALYKMSDGSAKWSNLPIDVELPGGAGIVPYHYSSSSGANAIQWATPLEFALSTKDVWRCALSTDSPNGGPFSKYPLVISWLMSAKQRSDWIDKSHNYVKERSNLPDIDREYTLNEIAIITRSAPAKILGIQKSKGHLGIGADADITVYDFNPVKINLRSRPEKIIKYFSESRYTFKNGVQICKNGKIGKHLGSKVISVHPELSKKRWDQTESEIAGMMQRWYSHSFSNYPVPARYRSHLEKPIRVDSTTV